MCEHVSCPPTVRQVRQGEKFNLNSGNRIVSLTAAEIDLDEIFVYKYLLNIFRKNQYQYITCQYISVGLY